MLPALLERDANNAAVLYLDPPFVTGDAFRVRRRSGRAGDPDDGGAAFDDRSAGGTGAFLAMLAPRLELARGLLSITGSLYLHLDTRTVHAAKLLCDEIFGPRRFRNHLVWIYSGRERARTRYASKHDDILYYARGPRPTFRLERALEPLQAASRRALARHVDDEGRPFVIRRRRGGGFAAAEADGATYRQYLPAGIVPRDWFTLDYARKSERTGYPTQKPEALLERLLAVSSDPGDLVVDLFAGSGTTAVVAAALGRRWIACDSSPAAIAVTRGRLLRSANTAGGFELAVLGGAEPGGAVRSLMACVVGGAVVLEGAAGELAALDAWAIGTEQAGIFTARTWAARHPWTRHLAVELALPAAGPTPGEQPLVGRAWHAAGHWSRVELRPAD